MTSMLIVAGVSLVLVLIAWGLWALVRKWDRTNAIVAAAAPLPIRMVNVWDPVWIRGDIECPEPVYLPHFGRPALHYDYKLDNPKNAAFVKVFNEMHNRNPDFFSSAATTAVTRSMKR